MTRDQAAAMQELIERLNESAHAISQYEPERYETGMLLAEAATALKSALESLVEYGEAIEEAIKFLGMDRPIDPREMLRATLRRNPE